VLLGDLNAAPHRPELAPLAAAGWREAAHELRTERGAGAGQGGAGAGRGGRAPRGGTTRRGRRRGVVDLPDLPVLSALTGSPARPTHPARFPVRRIDSLWVRGGVEVLDLETGALTASDHRPVVATLRT
jgi:endonuclease/exonuclease/phosphatase family metal-dependent hydrolase